MRQRENGNRSVGYDVYDAMGVIDPSQQEVVNQRFDQKSNNTSLSGRFVYTEPLTKYLFLEANYQYSWNMNTSNKDTYTSGAFDIADGLPVFNPVGEVLDDIYSNSIRNQSQNHRAGLTLSFQKKKFRANLGAAVNPTITDNKTNESPWDLGLLAEDIEGLDFSGFDFAFDVENGGGCDQL